MTNHKKPNRLIAEKSPYLLQHAFQPVDWYPWGEEAFAKARREDKPVFVSIGYSTCHWCHVMARESFEDEEVAQLLNAHFVSIKVDREERPDIDAIYMSVCQALTGHGGWPLSVFLTPDQKPFYAGTYFPKESRYGQPGFLDVLGTVASAYHKQKEEINRSGDKIIHTLKQMKADHAPIKEDIIDNAFHAFQTGFDPLYGGFGEAPKFPAPHQLLFLLRYGRWYENRRAVEMVETTLEGIANGGIHDHIGGGFARYATDRKWLVPHFEKMLYDQAMLMLAYSEAWQVTGNPRWPRIVEHIHRYVVRDMQDEKGGFYSAEDADSEGVEGKFYLWTPKEIVSALGEEKARFYCHVYGITEKGNYKSANIPNRIGRSLTETAQEQGMTLAELEKKLDVLNEKLFQVREKRVRPHKDDKILTSWNALMIAALATAGRIFKEKKYVDTAQQAFHFIENTMWRKDELFARYRDGDVNIQGYLDDYAFLMWACDALYEATWQAKYVVKMKETADRMIARFWDDAHFGFFLNQADSGLVLRPKEVYDGSLPSGNSVAAMMLLKLARRTGKMDYEAFVDKMFRAFGTEINSYPMGYAWFLSAYMLGRKGTKELVILTDEKTDEPLAGVLNSVYLPEVIALVGRPENVYRMAPYTKDFTFVNHKTTYYLCEHFACRKPTNNADEVIKVLTT